MTEYVAGALDFTESITGSIQRHDTIPWWKMGRGVGVALCHAFQMFTIIKLRQIYTLWAHLINMSEAQVWTKLILQVKNLWFCCAAARKPAQTKTSVKRITVTLCIHSWFPEDVALLITFLLHVVPPKGFVLTFTCWMYTFTTVNVNVSQHVSKLTLALRLKGLKC